MRYCQYESHLQKFSTSIQIISETCYSYLIPVADQSTPRECGATYGEGNFRCTMDEKFCMSVDCTDFEPLALTDKCQMVSLDGALQPERLML